MSAYTFLLPWRNKATFSHAPTAFVTVWLYILCFYFRGEMKKHFLMQLLLLSLFASAFYVYPFFLYPARFKFYLILLVSFVEPKLITLLIYTFSE